MSPDEKDALTFAAGAIISGALMIAAGVYALVSLFQ